MTSKSWPYTNYDGRPEDVQVQVTEAIVETDLLIVGAGPAGASLACFLGHHGLRGMVIAATPSTADTPRAHITNMAAMECLRDIGLEEECLQVAVKDNLTKQIYHVRSKYLFGCDGARSQVLRQLQIPLIKKPGQGLAINILVKAELGQIMENRMGNLHWVMRPDEEHPAFGWTSIVRMVDVYPFSFSEAGTSFNPSDEEYLKCVKDMIGDDTIPVEVLGVSKWFINETVAEYYSDGNVFCLGDAVHRHPPLNGLGSNTCIQDAYNLAWKIAYVLKGKANSGLLKSYSLERQPVGQSVITRANQGLRDHGPVWEALGMKDPSIEIRRKHFAELSEATPEGAARRARFQAAIEGTAHEFHGPRPSLPADPVLEHEVTTYPGSRLPHAWLNTKVPGKQFSTIDLAGQGKFCLLTGIGGERWKNATVKAAEAMGLDINVYSIGWGQDYEDVYFDWARRREVGESGLLLHSRTMLYSQGNRLVYRYDAEELWIEPWGPNALRIRSTKESQYPNPDELWALQHIKSSDPIINIEEKEASITNGSIRSTVTSRGKVIIYNSQGKILLEEYARHRLDISDPKCSAINIEAREFKPNPGGSSIHHLTMRFESQEKTEKIFGMGQYQQPYLDLKGLDLELAHRNSQASVPFALSSRGYGILWNNPSIGRAVLGRILSGDSPAEIVHRYAGVTGTVPMMPEYGLGFWQCKLRYQTQDELLGIAREYKRRDLPIDLIVIDFFHWPRQGDWRFDEKFWPDPDAMIQELKKMNIELMVSIWPTVDTRSENFDEMLEKGYLVRTDRGIRIVMDFEGDTIHFDSTNPRARKYIWEKAKKNYYDKGIRVFWLDEAEPEYTAYDFDNYRYHRGTNLSIGNTYPVEYARAFYEGMEASGQKNIVNLLRCAWAGSQKYGALVWSGDIASSWSSFRNQLTAGLNMGIAGIPWWTTDIGGFHGGDPADPAFRELFVRWFQWGTFCPVMRLHGDREPKQPKVGEGGGSTCLSGAPNEVWSYGEEVYKICKKYMNLREKMRDYTRRLMTEASENGSPVMRPLFYEFPDDKKAWEIEEQYMFGPKYLVCPIFKAETKNIKVYLPMGSDWWLNGHEIEKPWSGGQEIELACSIDTMPVFFRKY
ncbi:hypothetical protein DID88_001812 [Monilinia fructigena]|uniref:Uncharacterized protein n=1 Tax=Monilinia fructigena TaxID=38457 RepID=A0A395IWG1_9HELO|nr:hypothetical protein DID88_001812 [Monilinia fructigena]